MDDDISRADTSGPASLASEAEALKDLHQSSVLGDEERFLESEALIRRVLARGLTIPEAWLVLARALVGLGRFDEAEAAFREALMRRPLFAPAHSELAQLIWMRTGDVQQACITLNAIIAARPSNMDFRLIKAKLLEYEHPEAAYTVLAEAGAKSVADVRTAVVMAQLQLRINPASALAHAEQAQLIAPHSSLVLTTLCQANLALGRPEKAASIAEMALTTSPSDQGILALQATAWRLLGDSRYREMYDYARLVRGWTISTPPGWASLDHYLADLTKSLCQLHRLPAHPIGLSLRGGSQTTQKLDQVDDPTIKALLQALDQPIRMHIEALGSKDNYRFSGIWSVRLQPNGYHANHVHPMGWLSSACYIALPHSIERNKEGWIQFGKPGIPTEPSLEAEHFVKPAPGKLVLFPSYMWHGTIPFGGDEPRLTVAFDLIKA